MVFHAHNRCSFAYKVVCVDNKYSKKIALYRGKNAVKFIKSFVNEYNYCKTIIKLIVYSYQVTYAFQSESTLYSCLNVKELLARNRREI